MENLKLLEYISELEVRVQVAEDFMNAFIELNNLKVPPQHELTDHYNSIRAKTKKKYGI